MKKMPTLFVRDYSQGKIVMEKVTPGCEWVLEGEGEATEKVDGAACAIIGGEFYRRYDANPKKGRKPPIDGAPCQPEPDPVTGHWPFWVRVYPGVKSDAHFLRAFANSPWNRADGTYEAVGLHFQNNPYGLDDDFLERHGRIKLPDVPRTYDGIADWLYNHEVEGIVFWRNGEPGCKIKRTDFSFKWPVKHEQD